MENENSYRKIETKMFRNNNNNNKWKTINNKFGEKNRKKKKERCKTNKELRIGGNWAVTVRSLDDGGSVL